MIVLAEEASSCRTEAVVAVVFIDNTIWLLDWSVAEKAADERVHGPLIVIPFYCCYNVFLICNFMLDVAFPNGIAGGYLFLGNMVYTVSSY